MEAAPTVEASPQTRVILLRPNNPNILLATPHPRGQVPSLQVLAMVILLAVNQHCNNIFTQVTKAPVCRAILQDTDMEGAAASAASGRSLGRGQRLVITRGHSHMEASLLTRSSLDNNRGRDTGSNSTNNSKSCNNNNRHMEPCLGIPLAMGGAPRAPLCPRPTPVLANRCQTNTIPLLPRSISPSPCQGQYSTSHLRRQPDQRSLR